MMNSSLRSRIKKPLLLTVACITLGLGMISAAEAQKQGDEVPVAQDIKRIPSLFNLQNLFGSDRPLIIAAMRADLQNGRIEKAVFRDTVAMWDFYAARDGAPYWIEDRGDEHGKVAEILSVLEDSWTQALNPGNYHVEQIRALLKADRPAEKAQLELLVTDAVIRYGHDMTGMHMPYAVVKEDPQFWRKAQTAPETLAAIVNGGNAVETLTSLAPHDGLYNRLREELIALVKSPARAEEAYLPISFGGVTLRPGDFSKDVPKLRGRLGIAYDPVNGSERKYDDPLAAAVMTFQRENAMEADGNIGPKTLAMLNRSSTDKILQIVANMERLRWLDDAKPDRYVLVNIPSQTLWAVDHGNIALQMDVIVGRAERPTKIFVTDISGVRFNPKWTVPPTIKANDMLTHLQEDPNYLESKGIELSILVDGRRETLDPASIDWSQVTKSEITRMRMVQGAGDNNALGKVRVLMNNPYDIYLHDTSSPELFRKQERMLSSGCIRMSNPEAMARFILARNEKWSDEKMRSIIDGGRTTEVTAAENIPVYIVYQTIWLDDAGRLVYGPDVYKKDRDLIAAMNTLNIYHIPDTNSPQYASIKNDPTVH